MATGSDFILVTTASPALAAGPGAARGLKEILDSSAQAVSVPVEALSANFEAFAAAIGKAVSALPAAASGFQIEEIEFSAEVSAEGKLQLVGGISAGIKGGITFRLKRRPPVS